MNKHPRFHWLVGAGVLLHVLLFAGTALFLVYTENPVFHQQIRLDLAFAALVSALFLAIFFSGLYLLLFEPLKRLSREIRIIAGVNPGYTITLTGWHFLGDIPDVINDLGQSLLRVKREIAEAVSASSRELENSKARLETILTATSEGIIVCDDRARILFYNPAARKVFQDNAALGVSRSLYQLCSSSPIENSLAVLRQRRIRKPEESETENTISFVCSTLFGTVISCSISLLPAVSGLAWSFLLTCEDVSRQTDAWLHQENLLRTTMKRMRTTVTSLRLSADSLEMLPDLDAQRRTVLEQTMVNDARNLTEEFEALARGIEDMESSRYQLRDVYTEDVIACVARRLEEKGLILTQTGDPLWVKADIHLLLLLLEFLALRIRDFAQAKAIEIETLLGDKRTYFNFFWPGPAVPEAEIGRWKLITLEPSVGNTVAEVLELSGSEIWSRPHETQGYAVLLCPMPSSSRQWETPLPRLPARPIYTDFTAGEDLPERAALQSVPFHRIPFVVFDTETTGLAPRDGDEIVSLAGVKIINRAIIVGETFDRLVNPGRNIPESSIRFHGITDDMVRGVPSIEEVLRPFHAFVGDAVLVGHNVAFDMFFIKMKEKRAGITFKGPLLDTLSLSYYLHGHTPGHSLDAVAQRLGVEIRGRHTALGDALITAQVFIKFLYLLEAQGITTLGGMLEVLRR